MPIDNTKYNASKLYGYGSIATAQEFYSVARTLDRNRTVASAGMEEKEKFLDELIIRRLTTMGDNYFYQGLRQLELGKVESSVTEEEKIALMKATVENVIK